MSAIVLAVRYFHPEKLEAESFRSAAVDNAKALASVAFEVLGSQIGVSPGGETCLVCKSEIEGPACIEDADTFEIAPFAGCTNCVDSLLEEIGVPLLPRKAH